MKNQENIMERTPEVVQKELEQAEAQKKLWNGRVKSLKKEAEVLTPKAVEEAPVEEVEAAAEEVVEEAPVEEVEATAEEVVEEAPVEEVEAAAEEVVEEAPVEEVEATAEEVVEEEGPTIKVEQTSKQKKPFNIIKMLLGLGLTAWLVLLTALLSIIVFKGNNVQNPPVNPDAGVVTPGAPDQYDFVMSDFENSVVNIAKQYTNDEGITANTDILLEKIGEDKLVELIEKYGELPVQKAIAEFLAFVPEIKMQQYIVNNGLDYNPNAADDYSQYLDAADVAYTEATGKNPNGALMSLEGYDTNKSNRDAMKALIIESGDTALLTWYEAKTEGYDLMLQQERDTETALAYKDSVKTEILTSQGTVKLLELQLEQEANGTLTVVDNATMTYTDSYNDFIIDNYIYVIAN